VVAEEIGEVEEELEEVGVGQGGSSGSLGRKSEDDGDDARGEGSRVRRREGRRSVGRKGRVQNESGGRRWRF